jgi:hypothetical protein
MTETSSTRTALGDDTTHVLHFSHYCGSSIADRLRGLGLWSLMTADEYNQGRPDGEGDDWAADANKRTPIENLAAWVSALVGYPVTLTQDDELIDPDWGAKVAYRVRRSAS